MSLPPPYSPPILPPHPPRLVCCRDTRCGCYTSYTTYSTTHAGWRRRFAPSTGTEFACNFRPTRASWHCATEIEMVPFFCVRRLPPEPGNGWLSHLPVCHLHFSRPNCFRVNGHEFDHPQVRSHRYACHFEKRSRVSPSRWARVEPNPTHSRRIQNTHHSVVMTPPTELIPLPGGPPDNVKVLKPTPSFFGYHISQ